MDMNGFVDYDSRQRKNTIPIPWIAMQKLNQHMTIIDVLEYILISIVITGD